MGVSDTSQALISPRESLATTWYRLSAWTEETLEIMNTYGETSRVEKTSEPQGKRGGNQSIFVIHKHDASTLHYDFRLSIDGVLKSWAVPKGLSTRAGEKHLAIRTEDHTMDYAGFEGQIPKGQYGGGTVMVWDTGEVEPLTQGEDHEPSMAEGLENGVFKFNLNGKKLKGGYALVRMAKTAKQERWLIFKLHDEYADARRHPMRTEPDSVLTGRSMQEIAQAKPKRKDRKM